MSLLAVCSYCQDRTVAVPSRMSWRLRSRWLRSLGWSVNEVRTAYLKVPHRNDPTRFRTYTDTIASYICGPCVKKRLRKATREAESMRLETR